MSFLPGTCIKKPVMAACVHSSSFGGQRQADIPRPGSGGKTTCFQFRERSCLKGVRRKSTGVWFWLPDESFHILTHNSVCACLSVCLSVSFSLSLSNTYSTLKISLFFLPTPFPAPCSSGKLLGQFSYLELWVVEAPSIFL